MIKGLISPILTPFNDDLSINNGVYSEFAKHLLDNGCSGLAPFGTTGEALSVGNEERMNSIEGLINSGIDPNVLIPGTGLCNIPDTVMISRHAMNLGCHGVMVLPPFYYKDMNEEGIFNHYDELINRIDHPNLKHQTQKIYYFLSHLLVYYHFLVVDYSIALFLFLVLAFLQKFPFYRYPFLK